MLFWASASGMSCAWDYSTIALWDSVSQTERAEYKFPTGPQASVTRVVRVFRWKVRHINMVFVE